MLGQFYLLSFFAENERDSVLSTNKHRKWGTRASSFFVLVSLLHNIDRGKEYATKNIIDNG